jgi:hypothetical protein
MRKNRIKLLEYIRNKKEFNTSDVIKDTGLYDYKALLYTIEKKHFKFLDIDYIKPQFFKYKLIDVSYIDTILDEMEREQELKTENSKQEYIQFRISSYLKNDIKQKAKAERKTVAKYIRSLIIKDLE